MTSMNHLIELPYHSNSANIFSQLANLPWAVFLDSGMQGRYDIIAASPSKTLITVGDETCIAAGDDCEISYEDPFTLLKTYLPHKPKKIDSLPFTGGAIGYWGYDLGRRIEKLPVNTKNDIRLPEMAVGIYDWAFITDHQAKKSYFVTEEFKQEYQTMIDLLSHPKSLEEAGFTLDFKSDMSKAYYESAFNILKQYIVDGDCYQANFAHRFKSNFNDNPWHFYQAMRKKNPAGFGAYLNYPFATILSASPERYLQVKNNLVETKPIKGTRPRGKTVEQDHLLARELKNSEKDKAENLMIVDLLRNDLGKSCEVGSIKVKDLFALETFPNVHHLVSTIEGKLAKGKHSLDLLRDCFPGGSITGAPKIRAMEIIEELELHRRSIYCGAIGYIDFNGDMDTNIAIRTLLVKDKTIYCWAGGGIVADSDMESEYQETFDKVGVFLEMSN